MLTLGLVYLQFCSLDRPDHHVAFVQQEFLVVVEKPHSLPTSQLLSESDLPFHLLPASYPSFFPKLVELLETWLVLPTEDCQSGESIMTKCYTTKI